MPIIACNIASYRQYRDTAYAHLAKIGLTNVELACPTPDQADAEARVLKSLTYLQEKGLV